MLHLHWSALLLVPAAHYTPLGMLGEVPLQAVTWPSSSCGGNSEIKAEDVGSFCTSQINQNEVQFGGQNKGNLVCDVPRSRDKSSSVCGHLIWLTAGRNSESSGVTRATARKLIMNRIQEKHPVPSERKGRQTQEKVHSNGQVNKHPETLEAACSPTISARADQQLSQSPTAQGPP